MAFDTYCTIPYSLRKIGHTVVQILLQQNSGQARHLFPDPQMQFLGKHSQKMETNFSPVKENFT